MLELLLFELRPPPELPEEPPLPELPLELELLLLELLELPPRAKSWLLRPPELVLEFILRGFLLCFFDRI